MAGSFIGGKYKIGFDALISLSSPSPLSDSSPLLPGLAVAVLSSPSVLSTQMVRRPSLESTQSFELLSPPSGGQISAFTNSDDDEIVWGISSLSFSDRALFSPRSEDFVVLSPPSVASSYTMDVQAFIEDDLISNPPVLGQPPTPQPHSPRRNRRRRNCSVQLQQQSTRGQAPPQPPSKPADKKAQSSTSQQSQSQRKRRSGKRNDTSPPRGNGKRVIVAPRASGPPAKGFAARSVVDDVSEGGDDNDSIFLDGGFEFSSAVYDKAVRYINGCVLSLRCRLWSKRSSNAKRFFPHF